MSLLQNPLKALAQIDWYLDNQNMESFPGAFVNAAGNLSRQVLEQILFILAFYSGMPSSKYMKTNRQLRTAGSIINSLRQVNSTSGRTYFEEARQRGSRIRKFARYPRSLDKWRNELNELSHFRNPATQRRIHEKHIRDFSKQMQMLFDDLDPYLITAAVNEILSKGRVRAILADDALNTPGAAVDIVVSPKHITVDNGSLALLSPNYPIHILPDDEEVPLRWSKAVIILQHSVGMKFQGRLITEKGELIDPSSLDSMLRSFARTDDERNKLQRHLRGNATE